MLVRSWMAVFIVIVTFCVGCQGYKTYENSSAGFSISYPASWSVNEIPESDQISFGRSRVTVEIVSIQEQLYNQDVISYLDSMASINLESGRFSKQLENPQAIRVGEYQAARMRVIWVSELPLYFGNEIEIRYREVDLQINVIAHEEKLAVIVVHNADAVTDKMVKSFSFIP